MHNRALYDSLAAFVEEAAWQLAEEVSGGAEVPFELIERGRTSAPLYCYRPLTGRFIAERSTELSKLPYGRIEGVDLDAGRLTFIDSAGLRALLVCRDACRRRGVEFRLTSVSPTVGRIVAIAGVDDVLPGDG